MFKRNDLYFVNLMDKTCIKQKKYAKQLALQEGLPLLGSYIQAITDEKELKEWMNRIPFDFLHQYSAAVLFPSDENDKENVKITKDITKTALALISTVNDIESLSDVEIVKEAGLLQILLATIYKNKKAQQTLGKETDIINFLNLTWKTYDKITLEYNPRLELEESNKQRENTYTSQAQKQDKN